MHKCPARLLFIPVVKSKGWLGVTGSLSKRGPSGDGGGSKRKIIIERIYFPAGGMHHHFDNNFGNSDRKRRFERQTGQGK
jgi:hypothetical protein